MGAGEEEEEEEVVVVTVVVAFAVRFEATPCSATLPSASSSQSSGSICGRSLQGGAKPSLYSATFVFNRDGVSLFPMRTCCLLRGLQLANAEGQRLSLFV